MERKPLIGVSILAVVLLVMASLTNVVGYQSISSTTVNDSPLFVTRTQRAINKESNALISDYLGKGLHILQFPQRNNRIEQIQTVIEIIQKMDDKEFNKFKCLILSRIYNEKHITSTDGNNLLNLLKISCIPKDSNINQFNIFGNSTQPMTEACYTWMPFNCFTSGEWFPGCHLSTIFILMIIIFQGIWNVIWSVLTILPTFYVQ